MTKKTARPILNGTCHEAGKRLAQSKFPVDLTSIRASIANGPITELSTNTTCDSSSTSTIVATALTRGIKAEQSRQLKSHLLARGTHRLVAFWLRHPTRSIPSTNREKAVLLESAKNFMARYGCDKAGNPLQRVEASYKTGPSFSERKKYEIFEDILLWEDDEEEKLLRTGLIVAHALASDDDELWVAIKEPMAEYWERMAVEAQSQDSVMQQKLSLEVTEEGQRAAKELQVKVEVLLRKRLRQAKIYQEPVLETAKVDKRKLRWKKLVQPRRRK